MLLHEQVPTRRAVVDVNRRCNARCRMCYYANSRENWTKPLEVVRQELVAARQRGNFYVDFTGGEPTVHPQIVEIVEAARELGLEPCIITNGMAPRRIAQIAEAGCHEWLLSIHGLGEALDEILMVPGAWRRMLETIQVLKERNCYLRVNCTLTRYNATQLPELARFYAEVVDPHIVNFINFNPYYEWGKPEQPDVYRKLNEVQVRVSEVAPYLREAIDLLDSAWIWTNVRYFPMCLLRGYERHVCNIPQVVFDPFEWDYGACPKTVESFTQVTRRMASNILTQEGKCARCGIREVCGGLNRNYFKLHGDSELIPYDFVASEIYTFRDDLSADIIVPAYRPSASLMRLMNEIIEKTQPPYNLILIQKAQSAARNRNWGLERARSRYVIMVDDDITNLPYGWNRALIEILREHRHVLAVSARLFTPEGLPGKNTANNFDLSSPLVPVEMIPTACCAFRNTDLRFDERYIRAGWEDTDFFLQLRKARPGVFVIANTVQVVHLNEEKNDGGAANEYNRRLFLAKWCATSSPPASGWPVEEGKSADLRAQAVSIGI
ncbi:MAG: radical SAM protein [candidate division KSB1 bacterium]|nr:radical SAM protein [candidate division KSB1 bacterium]